MDRDSLIQELRNLISGFLQERGLLLVELIYRHEGRDLFLRILTDKPGAGINLDECAKINRQLSDILDENGHLNQRYILEVASPGADRPLKTREDFSRSLNKRIRFFLSELIDGKLEWEGVVKDTNGDSVDIEIEGKSLQIPLSKINKAKPVIF
ncbi:MAG: ribosome maturation factor RimP [Candidatus Omnitrophica bacterium]|nr:ribosome maturation factor RimP [Candidatus Omnitrophota bacterium]